MVKSVFRVGIWKAWRMAEGGRRALGHVRKVRITHLPVCLCSEGKSKISNLSRHGHFPFHLYLSTAHGV